jgi:predicted nucleic acid-binding protein
VIFIDTGAFLARYVQRDQHHAQAIAFWTELSGNQTPCYTSNLVLSEALTLLARRTDYSFAGESARHLYSSNVLEVLRPELNDEVAAIFLLEKYADQRITFCDCVSFALMRRHGIQQAFTFDGDFALAGFNVRP